MKKYEISEISDRIVSRLTLYLGILKELKETQEEINSLELAQKMNTTAVQVRKDLSTFGEFGVRGRGYNIKELINIIENILGINENNVVSLIGYGRMGYMIASHTEVLGKGFELVSVFDKDKNKIGKITEISNLEVLDIAEFKKYQKIQNIETVILAVNTENAQELATELVENGVKAILNMSACKLELPENIAIVNVDISARLKELNFWRLNFQKK